MQILIEKAKSMIIQKNPIRSKLLLEEKPIDYKNQIFGNRVTKLKHSVRRSWETNNQKCTNLEIPHLPIKEE